jgi:5-oxoprolinase (ATP-hydrolysing)
MTSRIDAWIDVGGTFTDCLVKIDGKTPLRGKTLSSGRIPISLKQLSKTEFLARELELDKGGFWVGATLVGYTDSGESVFNELIVDFLEGGVLKVSNPSNVRFDFVNLVEVIPPCEAPVLVTRRLLDIPLLNDLPPIDVRMGTTRGTNALLTRGGTKTALLVTDPFSDLLCIGDQTRPELFSLDISKQPPLASVTLTIQERLSANGTVLQQLNIEHARQQLQHAKDIGCESIAVSLLHGYRNPIHERDIATLAKEFNFQHISLSNNVAPAIEYVARTQTTVVDAYLSPVISRYLQQIFEQLGGEGNVNLRVMTSSGGLVDWHAFSGKDSILSGPAGGVIALQGLYEAFDRKPMIGLDMGGTSTDVCRVDVEPELQYESQKAGIRILTPTLPIETVASGGGSICWFDGVSLRVGPQSAGALPGPACYGRGGPLTITDLNVFSGRIPPEQFPFPLDLNAVESRIEELLKKTTPYLGPWTAGELVDAFRVLAGQQMAEAVRSVSIKQGIDPRDHVLVGFGGAAGQHICQIAESLDIDQVLDHPDAGLLSALGMGLATMRLDRSLPVYIILEEVQWHDWALKVERFLMEMNQELKRQAGMVANCKATVQLELRYQGTDATLTIPIPWQPQYSPSMLRDLDEGASFISHADIVENFSQLHDRRFGFLRESARIELVAFRLNIVGDQGNSLPAIYSITEKGRSEKTIDEAPINSSQATGSFQTVSRSLLRPGTRLDGPLLVLNSGSTLTVEKNWSAEVLSDGSILLNQKAFSSATGKSIKTCTETPVRKTSISLAQDFDPVFRDCHALRLSAIATQMGYTLQQTAISVNIKQRRDFSCAVFDAAGNLLANAPHVPVHLGAMGKTIRSVISHFREINPGDCFICNDPYEGGSHLPDLTVMLPIFEPNGVCPSFWVASRAHHADIGGLAPGSMSINAKILEEEGVVIPPFRWIVAGDIHDKELTDLVNRAKYPPRNWSENQADLRAQAASCLRGRQLLNDYAAKVGWETMRAYGSHLLIAAEERVRQFVRNEAGGLVCLQPKRSYQFKDYLEDGTVIQVEIITSTDGSLIIDFDGTGPFSQYNFNANSSIVTAAVLYVLRCLMGDELPLNEGILRAVTINIPQSVLSPPADFDRGKSPAVAAGNVETSQRVVDVLLGAVGASAASQGTMNNILFGNEFFGFYETLGGGSGATARAPGADAVHSHMTNTRLTDPEVLEFRYPVRLVDFRIRSGSGGSGLHKGGEGLTRTYQFLEPITLSLITSRRSSQPFGLAGGGPGAPGENWLELPDQSPQQLPANCQISLPANALLSILTPGGGGYGRPHPE